MSKGDHLFIEKMSQSANLENGHYCLNLLLNGLDIKMPNNQAIAEQHATTLKKKFLRNHSFRVD